jgi:hypothetical protein
MRTMFGAKATALLPSSAVNPFDFWCQWPLRNFALFVRVIAKMPFAKGILPPKDVTIIQPPSGNPEAEPNQYWLLL